MTPAFAPAVRALAAARTVRLRARRHQRRLPLARGRPAGGRRRHRRALPQDLPPAGPGDPHPVRRRSPATTSSPSIRRSCRRRVAGPGISRSSCATQAGDRARPAGGLAVGSGRGGVRSPPESSPPAPLPPHSPRPGEGSLTGETSLVGGCATVGAHSAPYKPAPSRQAPLSRWGECGGRGAGGEDSGRGLLLFASASPTGLNFT